MAKEYTIKTPNKTFTGTSYGVGFVNGEGRTTDPDLAQRLADAGYLVPGLTATTRAQGRAAEMPTISEVRVPLTDPDGVVRERTVAVVGGLTAGTGDGPDWTTVAEAAPTDPVAHAEARQEFPSDAAVIQAKTVQEQEKLQAAMPEPTNPVTTGGTDPVPAPDTTPDTLDATTTKEVAPARATTTAKKK